jgi:tetratricopeptide (TPR) repeat protein
MQKRLLLAGGVVVLLVLGVIIGLRVSSRPPDVAEVGETVDLDAVQAQIDAGDFASAKATLEAALSTNPDDAEVHFLLGLTYFNLQEYAQAKEFFNRAKELDSGRAGAVHHNLGVLAYQLGEMETALQEFQSALDIDPNDPDTHYQLGATYLVMAFPMGALEPNAEQLAQAQTEFESALDLAPDKPEALVGLANVYMFQNKLSDAITLLEKAVEQHPDMREALFALGRAYAVTGQLDLAKQTLEHFLETDPPEVWAEQAREILTQIGE